METYFAVIKKTVYVPGMQILMIEYNIPNTPPNTMQIHLAHAIHVKNKENKHENMYTLRCEVDQLEFIGDSAYKTIHLEKSKEIGYEKTIKKQKQEDK